MASAADRASKPPAGAAGQAPGDAGPRPVYVVPGAPTTADGEPGPHLLGRLRRLAELYGAAPGPVVLSGGAIPSYGSAAVETEAAIMARWLAPHVPAEHLLLETAAANTFENALNARLVLADAGLDPDAFDECVVPTTDWHVRRCEAVFKHSFARVRVVGVPSDDSPEDRARREAHEDRLLAQWYPRAAEGYREGHRGFAYA